MKKIKQLSVNAKI